MENKFLDKRLVAVPAGRLARLGYITTVAASVAGSMAVGGMSQLMKRQRPVIKDLLLTPQNIFRITEQLAKMRGAAMKIGQLISMDAGELLPPELGQIMARLRDNAYAMPPAQLKKVLNDQWPAKWLGHFQKFDVHPIAAASIGQVHRAQLKDGRDLAIKVQYPGVANSIDSDVANVGGFTMDELLPTDQLDSYYERFAGSLSLLDMNGVELIPQTMAPFPWHFGGQRYQNLFVHAEECRYWCDKLNLRMCFDISHSRLMSNHFGVDFYEFAERIAPITGHLHLGDASGVNGEGLQIGDGDLDFERLAGILDAHCPEASFIPEIWQGHKNGGEGFWVALERLEKII